ncbi:MAG: YfiR/HmsC family protein [Candidatus Latescibacterota bacterium]|jgi:hypothetical protein
MSSDAVAGTRLLRIGLIAVLLTWAGPGRSQEMAAPVPVQVPILLKALQFERTLGSRVGAEIVLGVAYQSRLRASVRARDAILRSMTEPSIPEIHGIPVRCVALDLSNEAPLDSLAEATRLDLLYVAPLRAYDLSRLIRLTRARGITSMTGVPEYCRDGITLAVGLRQERPEIMVNLTAARSEGADFSARLLRLARLVR